jgi:hypothetical protein
MRWSEGVPHHLGHPFCVRPVSPWIGGIPPLTSACGQPAARIHGPSVPPSCLISFSLLGAPVLSVLIVASDHSGQALQVVDVLLPADRHDVEDTYRL